MPLSPEQTVLNETVFWRAISLQKHLVESSTAVAHYTSAEVAFKIIRDQKVWMRNAIAMNDYSEVEYGERCLSTAWASAAGERFRRILDEAHPGVSEELRTLHPRFFHNVRFNTYLTCVSEHPATENRNGRLSMWRAYGGNNGVALVFSSGILDDPGDDLKAYATPVAYFTPEQAVAYFEDLCDRLEAIKQPLASCQRVFVLDTFLTAFRFSVLSTKHPGFHEEREWRVVYTPDIAQSPLVEAHAEVVAGVPQNLFKLPVRNLKKLERIIIGPSQFPRTLRDAFVALLHQKSIPDPERLIVVSDIPLRR